MTRASENRAKKKFNIQQPALTVTLKFNPSERLEILKFVSMLNKGDDGSLDMGTAEFCKRAVFYSINDAYRRADMLVAQQSQEKENGITQHDSSSGNSDGNNQEEQFSGSVVSATLSDQTNAATDSQA
jgi:hypothetical protein